MGDVGVTVSEAGRGREVEGRRECERIRGGKEKKVLYKRARSE